MSFPLKVRTWEQGDYFHPFGMKGKKKLSDFIIDQKVPFSLKEDIKVLLNSNNDIIWVVGYRMDNRFKITSSTTEIITIEILTKR